MKEKSTSIETRLAKYSAVAGALVAGTAVNAQVQYTDVNPDVTVTDGNPYPLDFNGDTNVDIQFQVSNISTSYTYAGFDIVIQNAFVAGVGMPAGNGAQGMTSTSMTTGGSTNTETFIAALSAGSSISSSQSFIQQGTYLENLALNVPFAIYTSGGSTFTSGTSTSGDFLGVTDRFVGVEFDAGGSMHYGWVRLDVAGDASSITIKDYAFDATPGAAIQAGDMGSSVGLEDVDVANKVSIRNQVEFAMINVTPDLIGGTVFVIDMTGQRVAEVNISDINTQVSFEGLAAGIYNISAQFDGGIVTEKMYVR